MGPATPHDVLWPSCLPPARCSACVVTGVVVPAVLLLYCMAPGVPCGRPCAAACHRDQQQGPGAGLRRQPVQTATGEALQVGQTYSWCVGFRAGGACPVQAALQVAVRKAACQRSRHTRTRLLPSVAYTRHVSRLAMNLQSSDHVTLRLKCVCCLANSTRVCVLCAAELWLPCQHFGRAVPHAPSHQHLPQQGVLPGTTQGRGGG